MAQTLLIAGLSCLIAAIVGGGLTAFQVQLPALQSAVRQAMLAVLGVVLIGSSLFIQFYKPVAQGGSTQTPATTAAPANVATPSRPPSPVNAPSASPASVAASVAPAPQSAVPRHATKSGPGPSKAEVASAPARQSEVSLNTSAPVAPKNAQTTAPETAKPPAPQPPSKGMPGGARITIAGVQCRTQGSGWLVEAFGSVRAAQGEPALFYTEIEQTDRGFRHRPECASWLPAIAGVDPYWYRVSCSYDPNSPVSTDWHSTVAFAGGRPVSLLVALIRPNSGKSFFTTATRPLDCP